MLMSDQVDTLLATTPLRISADIKKLQQLYDEIAFRINVMEGIGVASDQYTVIHRVLLKALLPNIALLYWQ